MSAACVECEAPIVAGEMHYVVPTAPSDLRPKRMHHACHEMRRHLAAEYRSGQSLELGTLRHAWAGVRAREGACEPTPAYARAKTKATVIASRLLAFKGPRAASEWS